MNEILEDSSYMQHEPYSNFQDMFRRSCRAHASRKALTAPDADEAAAAAAAESPEEAAAAAAAACRMHVGHFVSMQQILQMVL